MHPTLPLPPRGQTYGKTFESRLPPGREELDRVMRREMAHRERNEQDRRDRFGRFGRK